MPGPEPQVEDGASLQSQRLLEHGVPRDGPGQLAEPRDLLERRGEEPRLRRTSLEELPARAHRILLVEPDPRG